MGYTRPMRSEPARIQLIETARRAFGTVGYNATALDALVEAARVTRAALDEHFASKRELFHAVYTREQQELTRVMRRAAAQHANPWTGCAAGVDALLEASLDRAVQRITLLDAPSALGWQAMRDTHAEHGLEFVEDQVRAAVERGVIGKRPAAPLAHLLFGAACEGAMTVARSPDQRPTSEKVRRELRALIEAFAVGQVRETWGPPQERAPWEKTA
jgi:AcrR family transcriptional regulator